MATDSKHFKMDTECIAGGPDMYPMMMPEDHMEGVGEAFHCIAALAV
jgi:hypothetical protein